MLCLLTYRKKVRLSTHRAQLPPHRLWVLPTKNPQGHTYRIAKPFLYIPTTVLCCNIHSSLRTFAFIIFTFILSIFVRANVGTFRAIPITTYTLKFCVPFTSHHSAPPFNFHSEPSFFEKYIVTPTVFSSIANFSCLS